MNLKDSEKRFEALLADAVIGWASDPKERMEILAGIKQTEYCLLAQRQCFVGASDRVLKSLLERAMREFLHKRKPENDRPQS